MMKRFLKKSLIYITPFAILLAYYLYVIKNISGDIGWLGYIPFGEYNVNCNIPDKNRIVSCYSIDELKNAEIISIGDSFNKYGGAGSFSNYIGNELNCDIYRMQLTMSNYKLVDSLIAANSFPNCKVLILESAERALIYRLNYGNPDGKLTFDKKDEITDDDWKTLLTINDFNSFLRESVNYNNPINSVKLDGQYFSCDYCPNKLFFLDSRNDSELGFKNIKGDEYITAKENLMNIKSNIESKGIKMIFVVAADKYDMYYDYTTNNKYGKNPTLDYFSDIDSTFFVNSKSILKPYLDKGVKDVYLANDTHWSPVAAEIIGKHIAKIIKSKGCLDE